MKMSFFSVVAVDWQMLVAEKPVEEWNEQWTYAELYLGLLSASQTLHDPALSNMKSDGWKVASSIDAGTVQGGTTANLVGAQFTRPILETSTQLQEFGLQGWPCGEDGEAVYEVRDCGFQGGRGSVGEAHGADPSKLGWFWAIAFLRGCRAVGNMCLRKGRELDAKAG